jgi:ectoine hydroxylase-related dioxygenase (phytanoyl-CoA dioxygenase family)
MPAHVDTAFRSPDPPYSVCRMWCALEDIHPDSGRLYLVPGTHRTITPHLCREVLDERPQLQALFARIADEPDAWYRLLARGWPYVSAKVPDHIDPKAKVSFDLRKGDVVFFNPAVAHGTLACSNPTLTRKMMVCEWAVAEPETEVCEPLAPRHRAEIDGARRGNLVDLVSIRAARASAR